ncbi:set1/Ash2 histone methyltransferase complex subunit ASH2-like [Gigantopelta aegis]|uniref:set1/Ash2 histone methyltransferase complex subunit ASH2-like n=1 Tax=Gigantopelta aegis TaxID=1735272 RepID=UPI001B88CF53|nr:set1/Ash2 histone methyltransferase complex subunit ASH2-like [Gigantopelta aegis]XP_041364542.1 set1/Ash2 histone methyltransferase complex subunit ASH2-like [Gigantopelta aegis]
MEVSETSADSKMITDDSQSSNMDLESSTTPPDSEVVTCYCQKSRNIGSVELQCSTCIKWFHSECVSCFIGKCIPFMANYHFCCKNCSPNGMESFQKKPATFTQMCYTALANLMHQSKIKGDMQIMFSKDKDIIPYIDKNWEDLTTNPRRIKLTWHTTIHKIMAKESEMFLCDEMMSDTTFGLLNQDLSKIGPCFDLLIAPVSKTGAPLPEMVSTKGRSAKRKTPFDSQFQPGSKQKKGEMSVMKLPLHGYPLEHPFNKDGYRYILAEPDPHAPNKQAFDESLDWAGKPIPGYLYRIYLANEVYLALHDRAPQLKVAENRLTVTGDKGYSMIRATHGVRTGDWYYEVIVNDMPAESAVRAGWSQSLGNLQAPCGYDKFSYSWRSRKGTVFHESHGKHYSDGFHRKDVLGFYISLPRVTDPEKLLPPTHKDKPLVKFKSHLYYEDKDHVAETVKDLKPAPGSKMVMYKNGKTQGLAFSDLFEGVYFPAVSLYRNSTVTCNFGPIFKYPPKDIKTYKPISEAASQAMVQSSLADILFHIENEGNLPEF